MGGEIIFVIPATLGYAALVTLGATFVLWFFWIAMRRWGHLSRRTGIPRFPVGKTASALFAISLIPGCILATQPVPQPESARTVAAFEIPLTTAVDRADYLSILSAEAAAEGLDVNIETAQEINKWSEMSPELRRSIHAIAYRGGDFGRTEATISDQFHFGHVWVTFTQGENPTLARRFRDQLMLRTIRRWPKTLRVPVAQTGALPLREDLVLSDAGYEIDPARLAGYVCGTAPGNAPPSACN
ncbi:MAG TPA: hypothetical protein VF509_00660 [Sphingobium sp.]